MKSKSDIDLPFKLSTRDLGLEEWTVGSMIYKVDQGAYQATVVDSSHREQFRILIDGKTGEPVAKRDKKIANPMPVMRAIHSVEDMVGSLEVGKIIRKQGKAFGQAELLYNGVPVSKIKIDPKTGHPFDPAEKQKGQGKNKQKKKKKVRILPPGPATFVGWLGTLLALGGTFYFVWRRSALLPFLGKSETGGPARKIFNRTLSIHCWISFAALALIILHSANGFMKMQWNTSWLALAAILITSGSGMVGSSLVKTEEGERLWRRFHRPIVLILLILVFLHAAHKLEFI